MPAILDHPAESSAIDSFGFDVSGWLWLDDRQADIVSVEVRVGDTLLGEADALSLRPDCFQIGQSARLWLAPPLTAQA